MQKTKALFVFFFSAKSFIVSIRSTSWERVPGWLKSCLVAAERGSSKPAGLRRLLVVLEGEPLKEIFAQPACGG